MEPSESLVRAWRRHNEIHLFLIDALSQEAMGCSLSRRGGRDVARQFAHLHDVRVYQLEKRAPDLARGLEKFQSKGKPAVSPTKGQLRKALEASGERVERFLTELLDGESGRRGFRDGVFATFGYFIAHESHHRGSILLTVKECGFKLSNADAQAIWGMWDKAGR